jgi:hypothetical protein
MIKLKKKSVELLDAVTSVPYSRKGLGYTIGPSYLSPALLLVLLCLGDLISSTHRSKNA